MLLVESVRQDLGHMILTSCTTGGRKVQRIPGEALPLSDKARRQIKQTRDHLEKELVSELDSGRRFCELGDFENWRWMRKGIYYRNNSPSKVLR